VPLPIPILDDRSYQQLRDELIRRIPVYAPEWTDHNPSDPGITLIELFAFLGENLLYRFNQIPEATYLRYLKLLHIPLRPAAASRALVVLTRTDRGATEAEKVLVPSGTELKAGSVGFETVSEIAAYPVTVLAVARIAAPEPTTPEAREFTTAAIDARNGLRPGERAAYYRTEIVPEDPTAPGALPVNFRATVDGALWIAVLRTPTTGIGPLAKALLNIGFVPDEEVQSIDEVAQCPGVRPGDRGPEMIWEIATRTIVDGAPEYQVVATEGDTTRGLTQPGVVRLRLPDDLPALLGLDPGDEDLAGTGEFPPVLEKKEQADKLLFWIRARRRRDDRPLGRVLYVGVNATEVVQTRTANLEFLGLGTGDPGQTVPLVQRPVVKNSASVQVEENERWTDWKEVDAFEDSTEDSRVYTLDPEAGTVRFGNGVRGKVPQIGQRIRARSYQYGGGDAGNVGPKAITKITGIAEVSSLNPLRARGGAPAEAIDAALERIPSELRRRDRAVTAEDFQMLAAMTPGADVGRADCIPRFHPPTRNLEAAGVVSVVVWPREDRRNPGAPRPDRTMLREVCAWLDARRLVTTELYVIPPTYRKIAVAVGLMAKPGYGIEAIRRWVELVLRQYLAPLPPYGPDGKGWPLGRRVYGPELEAAALQVEGVEYLEGLDVAEWDAASQQWIGAPHRPILLSAWEVPELTEITVVEGPPLPPGETFGPRDTPDVPVPLPTVREEC